MNIEFSCNNCGKKYTIDPIYFGKKYQCKDCGFDIILSNNSKDNALNFVKEVAKYFMNFLETDFKKRRTPKRNTNYKTLNGLKVGIDLEKYPKLKNEFFTYLNNAFKKDYLVIKRGEYNKKIPATLNNLIMNKISTLSDKELNEVLKKTLEITNINREKYKKDFDAFLEETKDKIKNLFSKYFVTPFLEDLDIPLEKSELLDENSKYQIEIDIIDSLFSNFEEKLLQGLQYYFQEKDTFNYQDFLKEVIKNSEIKNILTQYFSSLSVSDAFDDLYILFRNNNLLDKTEMYLYLYELSTDKDRFPVFYIPLYLSEEENRFEIKFEKRLYVNTKAIDYVVQEFNLQNDNKATLTGKFDRILYLNEEENIKQKISWIIETIQKFFLFRKNISQTSDFQKTENLSSTLSNKCYLYIFDKSDEALINDYEEILNDEGTIIENFASLLNGFIEDNPKPIMNEIDDEWHEKSLPKRLIFESPIPLNDEQKQVIMALEKPDCKFLIIEGPPGTGKSHTITAIICKALLEEKSVLVLSDKKEALDVVEDKIEQTLNKIRFDDDFQNPILRLGKTGNKFYKIVQGQAIEKIRNHFNAYRHKEDEHEEVIKLSLQNLEQNIKDNISYFRKIKIEDIEYYFKNVNNYTKIKWVENENISEIKDKFFRIKEILEKLRKYKNCNYGLNFVTQGNYDLIIKLLQNLNELILLKNNFQDLQQYTKEFQYLSKYTLNQQDKINLNLIEIQNRLKTFNKTLPDNNVILSALQNKHISLEQTEKVFIASKQYFSKHLYSTHLLKHLRIKKELNINQAIDILNQYIIDLKKLKNSIFGYLFKKDKINILTRNFKNYYNYFNIENPEKNVKILVVFLDLLEFINSELSDVTNKEPVFRSVVNLLIHYHDKTKMKNFYNRINTFKLIVENINNLKRIGDFKNLKISEINTYILLNKILGKIDSIPKINSEIQNIDLKINVSNEHLLFEILSPDIDYLKKISNSLKQLLEVEADILFLKQFQDTYPNISNNISLNVDTENINRMYCSLLDYPNEQISNYFKLKEIEYKLITQFNSQPKDNYFKSIREIEDLVTAKMTFFLDKRIVEYAQDCAGEVNTLKNIIRKKQKFPKGLFLNLKKAFPCILAGIRDYAEFIPLEKDLFDLIIIDEASQVSIAQALPALVRGKQIIVLGDDKQFSNVKAGNASKVTNRQYKNWIQDSFEKERIHGEDNLGWIPKVKENFDIKNSILKFSKFIRNYECQLKKHFRCYPEIISYSDKYFYNHFLQCMKIRSKPVEDIIKIDIINHDGKLDETKNTNELEINFIISQLKEFKEKGVEQSLGIITPHREQVTLLFDKINDLVERDWLYGKCKLKIMTFDTCQGEERDYIFYSMVATREKDRLKWIFVKDFSSIRYEIDGTIKSQRMNVGFSRAKECIHFVLSKPIEDFQGEIKNALLHYKNQLELGKRKIIGGTDTNSPMEDNIQHYFYQTKFYKDNKDKIEFIPQFDLGKYLRQLDNHYNHPNYKVDFLLMYNGDKIVIEYDGFKTHFQNLDEINTVNYNYYMKDEDVYRQKILEGYGYKFLRINKFNIGKDPIITLNDRLVDLVKKKPLLQQY